MDTCTKDLGVGPRPVFGPEMVSSGWGIAIGVGAGLLDYVQTMTPEQKIAVGAGLLFVVGPTLGALAVAFPVAAPALLIVAEEVITTGVVFLGTGVYEKTKDPGPSAEPPAKDPTAPAPDPGQPGGGPSSGGRPDPSADPAPNSCMKSLSLVASCLGQRDPCQDPELAAELDALRDRACQKDIAYVDPDSEFCSCEKASPEEIAQAFVAVCQKAMSDRKPVPGESPCPLMYGAGSGSLTSSIPKICTQIMGDTITCPQMGDPTTRGPFLPPVCPLGAGSGARDCGPFPEVGELPQRP